MPKPIKNARKISFFPGIFNSVCHHYRIFLTLAFVSLVLSIAVFMAVPPSFRAEALIDFSPDDSINEGGDNFGKGYEEFIENQVHLLKSSTILVDAVCEFQAANPGYNPPSTAQVDKSLEVRRLPNTYMIAVAVAGPQSAGLAEMVNALVRSYLSIAGRNRSEEQSEKIYALVQERDRLNTRLERLRKRHGELAEKMGSAAGDDNLQNPYNSAIKLFGERLAQARASTVSAEAVLRVMENEKRNIAQRTENEKNIINDELAKAKIELKKAQEIENGLKTEFEKYRQLSASYKGFFSEAQEIELSMKGVQQSLTRVSSQVDQFTAEKRLPINIRLEASAKTPTYPSYFYPLIASGAVFLCGLIVSVLVPVGLEYRRPLVRSPHDLSKGISGQSFGWIMRMESDKTCMFAFDQIVRIVRTFNELRLAENLSSVAVTSVGIGGGATWFSQTLANSLYDMGVKSIIVEANPFNPFPAYGSGKGLFDVLSGTADVSGIILPRSGYLPDRLPVGSGALRQHFPMDVSLKNIVEKLSQDYDLVILDTAPIRFCPDTELAIRSVDHCLLLSEAEKVTIWEMLGAFQQIREILGRAPLVIGNKMKVYRKRGYFSEMLEQHFHGGKMSDLDKGFE